MANNASSQFDETSVPGVYKDEVTQKKIHEHLNNEDDIITEQDIANINTGIVQENYTELNVLTDLQKLPISDSLQQEEETEEKTVKDNEDTNVDTSWNILGA